MSTFSKLLALNTSVSVNNKVECIKKIKHTIIERISFIYKQPAEGRGIILDPHTVEIRGADGSVRQLRTKNILVATGGHAVKLSVPGAVSSFIIL